MLGSVIKADLGAGLDTASQSLEDYKKGTCPHEATLSERKYGIVNHTLILEGHAPNSGEPEAKRPKLNQNWDERYNIWKSDDMKHV